MKRISEMARLEEYTKHHKAKLVEIIDEDLKGMTFHPKSEITHEDYKRMEEMQRDIEMMKKIRGFKEVEYKKKPDAPPQE